MKNVLISLAFGLLANVALAQKIDPATTFPWMNSATDGGEFKMADHPGGVFVFEAYSITCAYCNQNAVQVNALATQYAADTRVTVIDLGQDTADRDYRNWIAANSPNHPVVKDSGQGVYTTLKQEDGIPQTFVVACDGSLAGYSVGLWGDAEKQALAAAITKAEGVTCN